MQPNNSAAISAAVNAYLDTMFGEARPGNRGYREIGNHAWHDGKTFADKLHAMSSSAGWISIKDRAPVGDGVECLCFWNGHTYIDHYYDGSAGGEPGWEGSLTPWYWMPRPADPVVDPVFLSELASQRESLAKAA
ncbi:MULTISPECIES: hypothetical protein [unclassified Cupriavidus]|uniref:hypothetical protein n=1 Tax=unclassified Cupriavidus TaxID=2640874 RepID=UPI00313EABA4